MRYVFHVPSVYCVGMILDDMSSSPDGPIVVEPELDGNMVSTENERDAASLAETMVQRMTRFTFDGMAAQ
jgi:hypothetical protein